jgi:hypothetical protein
MSGVLLHQPSLIPTFDSSSSCQRRALALMPEACIRTTPKAEDPVLAFVQRHQRRGW